MLNYISATRWWKHKWNSNKRFRCGTSAVADEEQLGLYAINAFEKVRNHCNVPRCDGSKN